ncbi:uncharacterized protein [Dysidea avara]|uniref:uncharacterized protein n=1 Tax=Dysidea avara TaxID=196820 RepID=UPI00332F6847
MSKSDTRELRRFWELESLGITEESNTIDSLAFPQDTKFDWTLGRYMVDLPWRHGCWPQSNGFSQCLERLKRLRARLQDDSQLLKEYDDIFKKQLEDNIIERVETNEYDVRYHYLPHHGVIREDKQTTRLRIVFDGSAKEPNQLSKLSYWDGPEFLTKPSEIWPHMPTKLNTELAETERIQKPPVISITHSLVSSQNSHECCLNIEAIMDVSRYRSLLKLMKVTGLVLKFISVLKNRQAKGPNILDAKDLRQAEDVWVTSIQLNSFPDERSKLVSGEVVVYRSQLMLFLSEEGLIRCTGRLNEANLPSHMKNPVLLPTRHPFTELIIEDRHHSVKHNGIQETLALIRENFWIVKGREAVKKVLRKCVVCKRYEGKPYPTPMIADLPAERPTKESEEVVKLYVCLFTCASTRALHLEVVQDLSAPTFLQAFRRFCGRRGLPSTMMSDNAKTFKASAVEVQKSLTRRARYQYQLLKSFVRQWQRDYLLSLRERAINHGSQKNLMIKEGDIVVLKEDCTARCLWKLAKIVELITGRDGRTRAAKVQLLSKDKVTTIRRPVQNLVPLEVN